MLTTIFDSGAALAIIPAVIAAMGGILKLVLNYLERVNERADAREAAQEEAMARMQASFEKFMGNHMSGNTRALRDVNEALHELAREVRSLKDESRNASGRN